MQGEYYNFMHKAWELTASFPSNVGTPIPHDISRTPTHSRRSQIPKEELNDVSTTRFLTLSLLQHTAHLNRLSPFFQALPHDSMQASAS